MREKLSEKTTKEEGYMNLHVASLTIAMLLAVGLIAWNYEARSVASSNSDTVTSLTGDFKVFYQIYVTERESIGPAQGLNVKSIQFHDSYILLITGHNKGRVLPITRLSNFKWEPQS